MNLRMFRPLTDNPKTMDLFDLIDANGVAGLEHAFRIRSYDEGQMLFQTGDPCRAVSVVLSGTVCLYFQSEDGHEVIFHELCPGEMIGEIELALGSAHSTSGMANEPTRVLEIDKSAFSRLSRQPQVAEFFFRSCAHKLREALKFAEGIALHPIETRLARLLIDLADNHGRPLDQGILIEKPISQNRMGQLINASRPRVNAQLQIWKSNHVIELQRNRILIRDPEHLRRRSQRIPPVGDRF